MQVDEDNDASQKYMKHYFSALISYRKVAPRFERLFVLRFDRISYLTRLSNTTMESVDRDVVPLINKRHRESEMEPRQDARGRGPDHNLVILLPPQRMSLFSPIVLHLY
jgi:hypothetical protein